MKKVFIQTYGCQMNEYDSEQMRQILFREGFESCDRPEDAQLLLINSCSVREKSEVKALSFLGRMAQIKEKDPHKVIGFGGCVGQTEGEKLLKRHRFLDFAFGTNNYRDLPKFLEAFQDRFESEDEMEPLIPQSRPEAKTQAFITITNGCDKFCSYCIVPFTRGRELSRGPEEILHEAKLLVQQGVSEIMLLGQNVNSYWGKDKTGKHTSLHELLVLFQEASTEGLEGLRRLRYTTSHPRDFDEELARDFRDLPILCEYLHLPFQSGSDQILRKMRRFYSIESYLRKMEMVKSYCPDIALSADVIVGFPGETRQDFEATLRVLEEVEFDNVYSFKYSVRPYTRSEKWEDDVPAEEKSARIQELQRLQRKISEKKYSEDVGRVVELLLEGASRGNPEFWTGRTRKNRVVHIPTESWFKKGLFVNAKVHYAAHSWMKGDLISWEDSQASKAQSFAKIGA
ncbi:MAG: tRNA (N6-isopentenyl adenosine(37)-C2)-methylthiotransferase MiaB [Bradymonadales bacterium]|nr:MAG: tRNA (N6-isopentenyl adenosine(37)-C2)-methylthiotransferase MiaB [Bradymonadales bacterium]